MPTSPEIALVPFRRGEGLARWRECRNRFEESGLWPLIVSDEVLEWLSDSVRDAAEEGVLEEDNLDGQAMFAEILRERARREEYEGPDLGFDPATLEAMDWPSLEDALPEGSHLALVPCGAPWQAPAILGNQGSDLWPSAGELAAALREWHALHGAEPIGFGSGSLTLIVRPIEDPAEAKRVAIEQYALCEDMGNAGEDSIRELARVCFGCLSGRSIAGQLRGTIEGVGAIPARWLDGLELREEIAQAADDLYDATHGRRDAKRGLRERYPA